MNSGTDVPPSDLGDTMFELKRLSKESIDAAMEKAMRYRLLNEPRLAESICLDIVESDPENHDALVMLLLSLTDQFGKRSGATVKDARAILPRLSSEYERAYYAGLICERRGKSLLEDPSPGTGHVIHDWLREAMAHYERAEAVRPAGNEEALLRWNTCARMLMRHEDLRPLPQDGVEPQLE